MKKFRLFSFNPPVKGVSKNDERASVQTDFKGFFIMYARKFWNISNVNLLMSVFMLVSLFGLYILRENVIAYYIYCFVSVLLFGLMNTASTYVMRGYVRGDPVYIFSDFKHAIKANFRQGLLLGIIDALVIFLLIFDISFWTGPIDLSEINNNLKNEIEVVETHEFLTDENSLILSVENQDEDISSEKNENEPSEDIVKDNESKNNNKMSFFQSVSFYTCLFLLFIYLLMRNYIYLIMVTFKLSVFKILKNAFIFAFLGFKRNIIAGIGILLACALNVLIFAYLAPVGIVLPFIITTGTIYFISTYAAYPVIKKYMIAPYYKDEEVNEAYDKIFTDRE